ncbi:MAG: hypothetical protein AB7L09_01180 [Nitrospira sp.]
MAKMYERVRLVRPIHLDFTGDIMEAGTEATVVDLLDDDVVLIEFDVDTVEQGGGKRVESTIATVFDIVSLS